MRRSFLGTARRGKTTVHTGCDNQHNQDRSISSPHACKVKDRISDAAAYAPFSGDSLENRTSVCSGDQITEDLFSDDEVVDSQLESSVIHECRSICEKVLDTCFSGPLTERLDRFLSRLPDAADISRERIKQAITDGTCLVDGNLVNNPAYKLRCGQKIECRVRYGDTPLTASETPVEVLYADMHIAVIVKPAGLTVHPCPSCHEETLAHRLLGCFPSLYVLGGQRPGIVHRLDKDTSGLMIVALSEVARLKLIDMFSSHEIHKTYLALVRGIPEKDGRCDEPVGRHPTQKTKMAVYSYGNSSAREALTEWHCLYADPSGLFSLLAVRLHTGRTHQIRVHMQHCGHPLWGDAVYGVTPKKNYSCCFSHVDPAARQMLHAWKLVFKHPITGDQLSFVCPPPKDFWDCAMTLHRKMPRVIVTGCPAGGKSAFSQALAALGLPVWSADADVKRLYAPGGDIADILASRYGSKYVDESGQVIKTALFASMCESTAFRMELQGLVHPVVSASMQAFFKQAELDNAPFAVAEVPLWFESGYSRNLPIPAGVSLTVVGVSCSDELRHARLSEKRGWSPETIRIMDSWQWPNSRKMDACDVVINNDGSLDDLAAAAETLKNDIINRTQKHEQVWLDRLAAVISEDGDKSDI